MADSVERIADELDLMAESVQAMSPATKERKLHNIATRLRALSPAGGGEDDCEVLDAAEALMRWCVKNVKKWHLPEYDRLHAACERKRAALAASPQQEPGAACPHIVQSKEGTAYCRLAESAGASGGGVPAAKTVAGRLPRESECTTEAAHFFYAQGWNDCRVATLTATPHPAAPQPQEAPLQKMQRIIDRVVTGVMEQREEVLSAFVAKHGFQPDEAVQVIGADGSWRVIRRSDMYTPPAHGDGEVDEDSVLAAVLNEQPFADRNDATRIWQMIDSSRDAREVLRAVVRIVLTTRPTPEGQDPSGQPLAGAGGDAVKPVDVERALSIFYGKPWPNGYVRDVQEKARSNMYRVLRHLTATSAGTTGDEGWISVYERLPDEGDECLVLAQYGYDQNPYVAIDTWRMQREAPVSFSSATIETGLMWDEHDFLDVLMWQPVRRPSQVAVDAARRARTGDSQ